MSDLPTGGVPMNDSDLAISRIAAAIGEPARARILCSLMDGRARTSTELAIVAGVSPSTASVHLHQLMLAQLINVLRRGKYRYFSLERPEVAQALESLAVLAGGSLSKFAPNIPSQLRDARTCYDHIAGKLGVLLHNRFKALGWLLKGEKDGKDAYDLSQEGIKVLGDLGVDLAAVGSLRRRFAYPCLDWSERQPHIGGALGAALLGTALRRKWVIRELDSRALRITRLGRHEIEKRLGLQL